MILLQSKNIKKKNSSFFNATTQVVSQPRLSNFNEYSNMNYSKDNSNLNHKKIENPLDFIKQKKRFFLHNCFDVDGAKNFIESKEIAMKEIKLYEDILYNEDNLKTDGLLSDIDNNPINKKNSKIKKKKASDKSVKENDNKNKNDNRYKKAITKKKKSKCKNNGIINDNNNSKENSDKHNNIFFVDKKDNESKEDESKDNEYFYKFIIDNADESEEKFHKKLERVIKKVETQKQRIKKEKIFGRAFTTNKINQDKETQKCRSAKKNTRSNFFVFSEKAKNLMTHDDLELSSISSAYKILRTAKDDAVSNYNKLSKKEDNNENKKIFGEEENRYINNAIKDSIVSILDNLVL